MTAHLESSAALPATPTEVFAYVDDPTYLAAHMAKPSWTMAGGYMNLVLDEMRGREAGARIRLAGRVLGVPLEVDELVVERTPPRRKVWQTVGTPRLLLIGSYRMGFDVAPRADGSLLRVFSTTTCPRRCSDAGSARFSGTFMPVGARRGWCAMPGASSPNSRRNHDVGRIR